MDLTVEQRAPARIAPPRNSWAFDAATWAVVVLGSLLRIRQWVWDRSLWGDEAAVANQIVQRSYAGLSHPLPGKQGAPLGWLWVEHTTVVLLGSSERALRLFPLLSGLAALLCFSLLARRVIPPFGAVTATALFAFAQPIVYYSNEVKQYETDTFVVVAALLILSFTQFRGVRLGPLVVWFAAAPLLVFLSHVGLFVVAVGSAVIVLRLAFARRLSTALRACAASLGWVTAFGVEYVVSLRALHGDPALKAYWILGYPPRPFRPGSFIGWLGGTAANVSTVSLGLSFGALVGVVAVVGFVHLCRRREALLLPIAGLASLAIFAAAVQAYPLRSRLALYLAGPVFLCIGASVGLGRESPAVWRRLGGLGAALGTSVLVAPLAYDAAEAAVKPYTVVETRPAVGFILAHWEPGDKVYVSSVDVGPAIYYHYRTGLPLDGFFSTAIGSTCNPATASATLGSADRVWLLFGYPPQWPATDNAQLTVRLLQGFGRVTSGQAEPGDATAVLLQRQPQVAPAGTGSLDDCLTVVNFPAGYRF